MNTVESRLISACQQDWDNYTEHAFVRQLAAGTLPQPCYAHYLQQDFLFLKQYARAWALAIYKSDTLEQMRANLPAVQGLLNHEIGLHVEYCAEWGLDEASLQAVPEETATVAYTRYVLDCGQSGDQLDLHVALSPCSVGYAVIGRQLLEQADTVLEGNPYRPWIEMYNGEEFQKGAQSHLDYLNTLLAELPDNSPRWPRLQHIFATATRMEVAFWQQGLDAA